jgi:hypothetical protein
MSHDYSGYEPSQSEDALAQLSELAEEQQRRASAVNKAEEDLKFAQSELRKVAEEMIPELMITLGIEEFTTISGLKISIKEQYRASIRADFKNAGYAWLRENGHAAIIKRVVKVQFGMGEDEMAQKAIDALEEQFLPVEDSNSIPWQTMARLAKDMREDGQDLPEELFSVHLQRISKIKI